MSTAWICRPLNGRGHRALAIRAGNASMRRIFPRWQSRIQSRTRKPTTHKYSSATFNGVKRCIDNASKRSSRTCQDKPACVRTSIAVPDSTDASFQNPCHTSPAWARGSCRWTVTQRQSATGTVSSAAQLTLDTPLSMLSRLAKLYLRPGQRNVAA